MSEAPEDLRDLEQMHQDWLNAPTLSDAMQLPEVRALVEAVTLLQSYVPTDVIECNGDKCREPWCASCCGWDDATNGVAVAMGHAAVARAALAPFTEAKP